ncbi:MAG: hypothetical protein JW909_09205 [Planctomycetes bacterium]|nr:hypothetical protein [Planctomycetota bacterium]
MTLNRETVEEPPTGVAVSTAADGPFMGFPEGADKKSGQLIEMTRVWPSDYDTYLRLKEKGELVAEVRRGDEVFFAYRAPATYHPQPEKPGDRVPSAAHYPQIVRRKTRVPTSE